MPPSSEPFRSDPSSKDYSRRSQRWNTTSPPSSSTNPEHERLSSTPRARGVCIRPTQRTLQFWSLVCDATPSRAQYPSRRIIQFQSIVCDATPSCAQNPSRHIIQSQSLGRDATPSRAQYPYPPHSPVRFPCLGSDTRPAHGTFPPARGARDPRHRHSRSDTRPAHGTFPPTRGARDPRHRHSRSDMLPPKAPFRETQYSPYACGLRCVRAKLLR
jgi:hypothetical protein